MTAFISRSAFVFLLGLAMAVSAQAAEWTSSQIGTTSLLNTFAGVGTLEESKCPAGKYIVGLEIRSGTLVDAMRAECASLGPSGEHQNLSQTDTVGSVSGGRPRLSRCPAGQVMTAVRARTGEYIDQVSFACRSWSATQGLHGSLRWQPKHGGSGGEPVGPIECPSGKAMTKIRGVHTGPYIARFWVTCTDLPPTQPATTISAEGASNPQERPASNATSRPTPVARGVHPAGVRAATALPQSVAPVVKALRSKPARGNSAEITIDGEHFMANQGGRQTKQVTRVEIAGESVPYRVVSSTRITATVPIKVINKLDKRRVPIVITSGGKRIAKQLPLR